MSSAPTMCANPCETCAKEGLPLLLTRYALMPSEAHAPALSGQLAAPELDKVPLGQTAHYGLRLLRSGYVYVFDEKRSHWDEYFVTNDGYVSKLPPRVRALKMQARPATEFRCARNGAAPLAGVITIQNPKHAGKVWLSFSDVEWTDAVFQRHMDAGHRTLHMQSITLNGGKVTAQPRTAPIENAGQVVPEFKLDAAQAVKQFGAWSPHAFNSRQQTLIAFDAAIKKVRPEGGAAIVALHDPVGLVMEIASLMEVRKVTFMNRDGVTKPRFAASSIATLESSIREQAKLAEIEAGELLAQRAETGPGASYPSNAALWDTPGDPGMAQRWRTHTPQSLQKVADAKWRAYTHDRMGKPRFDASTSRAWLTDYNEGIRKFDAQQIAPLAKAHVAWMRHRCMVSHMSCNYDSADLGSGAAYTSAVAHMLRHTCDKQPSYDLYVKWLKEGDTSAASNLIMRALGFNQDKLLDEINKADAASLDARAFPSDLLIDYVKDGLEKLPPGGHAAMADLLQSAGGAILKNMDELGRGGAGARAIAAVAAVAGVQFTRLEVKGSRGKFVQHMMQAIMQLDPNMKVNPNQMGKALAAQMRLMEIEGLPMSQTDKRHWLVVLDRAAAKTAAGKGLVGDALAAELAKTLRQGAELPQLKARAFKAGVSGTAFDAGGNFVIGLVQSFNAVKLISDYTQGMSHEKNEAAARLITGGLAILGSFGEASGLALQKMQEAGRLRNSVGLSQTVLADRLVRYGKGAGLVTGLMVAGMDLMKAVDEGGKGDQGLMWAYVGSSLLGFGLSIAFFISHFLGPLGWLLVGLAVISLLLVTFWIETSKDNKIQEWLMRCHFGSNSEKYKTLAEEEKELERAFA